MKSRKPIGKEAARADPDTFQAGMFDDRKIEVAKAQRALKKAQTEIRIIAEAGRKPVYRLRIFGGWIETTDPELWQSHVRAAARGRIHIEEPAPYTPRSTGKAMNDG